MATAPTTSIQIAMDICSINIQPEAARGRARDQAHRIGYLHTWYTPHTPTHTPTHTHTPPHRGARASNVEFIGGNVTAHNREPLKPATHSESNSCSVFHFFLVNSIHPT